MICAHNTSTSFRVDMRVRQTSGPFGIVRDYHGLLRRVDRITQIVTWGVENGRCYMYSTWFSVEQAQGH